MRPEDKDDFTHSLGQTLKFFGQQLETWQVSFWLTALNDYSYVAVRRALLETHKRCRFAPKPKDVIAIIEEKSLERADDHRAKLEHQKQEEFQGPTELGRATLFWIRHWAEMDRTGVRTFPKDERYTREEIEHMLVLVNAEARRMNDPGRIPEDFRVESIWNPAGAAA